MTNDPYNSEPKKRRFRKRYAVLGVLVALIAGVTLSLRNREGVELALEPIDFTGAETPGAHNCFWIGPANYRAFNIAFPDEGAIYWPTVFELPEGASLEITGTFPKARYMSFHSYDENYSPYHRINDEMINATSGTQNPFTKVGVEIPGTYKIQVLKQDIPENPSPNTLYLGAGDIGSASPIILRVYVPETDGDLTGGAGLPEVSLITASGDRIAGEEMCNAVKSPAVGTKERTTRSPIISKDSYLGMLAKNDTAGGFPASNPVEWLSFWDPKIEVMRVMSPRLLSLSKTLADWGLWKKTSGFYAAIDNNYISAYLNSDFGEVVVLEGQMPRTPARGWDWSGDDYDLRYWSICTNEGLATTRFSDCIYDSGVVIDTQDRYRIVVSKAKDRPANATAECGVNWLDWGDVGDGAGNENIGVLIIRNMLPHPNFEHAIQRTEVVGKEAEAMGEFFPQSSYMSQAAFELLGCT